MIFTNQNNLPIDTKIMVSDDGKTWIRRYLHHLEKSLSIENQINAVVFPMGCDSWTHKNYQGNGMNPRLTTWTIWRLATEEDE